MDDTAVRVRVGRVESLLEAVEAIPDPNARGTALETVQAVVELYGAALERVVEASSAAGGAMVSALVDDELLSHLLIVHDLHPEDVDTRVGRALEEVRPYLRSHGGNVDLLRIADGVAYLRLQGSCSGCPSSATTLKLAVEEAIMKAAPELERIEAEGVAQPQGSPALVLLEGMGVNGGNGPGSDDAWAVAGALPQLAGGGMLLKEIGGEPVLFLSLDSTFYAYRPNCPSCGTSLEGGSLEAGEIGCPECDQRYDARRAGRCLDSPQLFLEPIPLLVGDSGMVRVAIPESIA